VVHQGSTRSPADEHREACQRKPFRAADAAPRIRIAIAPTGAGTRIEQDADDRKIEFGARPLREVFQTFDPAIAAQRSSPSTTKCRQREWNGY